MVGWLVVLWMACGTPAPEVGPASAPAASTAPAKRVEVMIDGMGYTPAAIDAAPGQDLTLVFERADANNCGGEVVFPSTGARHDIPVGKKVEVAVKAPQNGKLAFTCGMGMYEGTVVVSGG